MEKSNAVFFSKVLQRTTGITTSLEFGSNIGLNLKALHYLDPSIKLSAIEINADAIKELSELEYLDKIHHHSILDFEPKDCIWDMVFIKGVLIHINPEYLPVVYEKLYNCSSRYVLVAEYYNPTPMEINYRGHAGKLFKRDFAGELLDKYSDLTIVDYGFVWRRDPNFPQDDMTWFLLEKK